MAKSIQLKAEPRSGSGTTASKAVRKAGNIPAIIYGRHQQPQSLQLNAHGLKLALSKSTGAHALVDLEIVGGTRTLAIVQHVQVHPVKRHILHLDFHALHEDEIMHTTVAIIPFGEAAGVKNSGALMEHQIRNLDVECLPKDLPDSIIVDLSAMVIGDYIHVSDIALPAGVVTHHAPAAIVFHCAAPTVEVEPAAGAEGKAEPEVLKEKKPAEGAAAAGDAKKPAGKK